MPLPAASFRICTLLARFTPARLIPPRLAWPEMPSPPYHQLTTVPSAVLRFPRADASTQCAALSPFRHTGTRCSPAQCALAPEASRLALGTRPEPSGAGPESRLSSQLVWCAPRCRKVVVHNDSSTLQASNDARALLHRPTDKGARFTMSLPAWHVTAVS